MLSILYQMDDSFEIQFGALYMGFADITLSCFWTSKTMSDLGLENNNGITMLIQETKYTDLALLTTVP